jgi:hypothetical protein
MKEAPPIGGASFVYARVPGLVEVVPGILSDDLLELL